MNVKSCRRFLAIIIIIALISVTAACGKKKPDNGQQGSITTESPAASGAPQETSGNAASADPNATPAPDASADPNTTSEPFATPDPNATPAPVAPTVPAFTEEPGKATDTPAPGTVTSAPTVTPAPGTTDTAPTATPAPGTTDTAPTATPAPGTTDTAPTATPAPGTTDTAPTAPPAPGTTETAPTAAPSGTPSAASTPTPVPTNTPAPDPVTALTWLEPGSQVLCDLDFDSRPETIELYFNENPTGVSLVTLRIKVGKNNRTLEDSFAADTFINALVNNFNTGDNRVEIIVSARTGSRNEQIKAYRLNDRSDGLASCKLQGSVYQIDGNNVRIHRYADLMGTWDCVAPFAFSYEVFRLEQVDSDWDVLRDQNRTCTLKEDILVGVYSSGNENLTTFVYAGTRIYPIMTDLSTRIDIVLESGAHGFITVELDPSGRFVYGGTYLDDYFEDLIFLN